MAILKGKDLLDRVRRKIKDETYGNFDEINEAQMLIAEQTNFWWLRKSNIVGAGLEPSTKEYDLNLSDVREIEQIYIATASTTSVGTITGVTLSSGDAVAITLASHGLTTGRQVTFSGTVGTTELNGSIYRVTSTGTDTFTLDGTDSDNFTTWTSGGACVKYDINDGSWPQLMTEAPSQLFEENVQSNSDETWTVTSGVVSVSTTSADTSRNDVRWSYYLKGGSAPFSKFIVSPTPSSAYKIKINYIRLPVEITEEVKPDIPTAYHTLLIDWASGIILIDDENPVKAQKGARLVAKSERRIIKLVANSASNRAGTIDRPAAKWKF